MYDYLFVVFLQADATAPTASECAGANPKAGSTKVCFRLHPQEHAYIIRYQAAATEAQDRRVCGHDTSVNPEMQRYIFVVDSSQPSFFVSSTGEDICDVQEQVYNGCCARESRIHAVTVCIPSFLELTYSFY